MIIHMMEVEEKKGLTNFPSYTDNPFNIEGLVTRRVTDKHDKQVMYNEESGEYMEVTRLGSSQEFLYDPISYNKVYRESLPTIKDFSSPALKVWCYVLTILKPNKDIVLLNMEECKKYTGYSAAVNVYKGIVELLEKNFLARSTGGSGTYFINSNLFFNGDRRKI